MPNLSAAIRTYYFNHFNELPADKQFHFASRLSAWNGDAKALTMLDELKPTIATDTVTADLQKLIDNPPAAKINAAKRRAPYFKKYPQLRGYMFALFRVRHLLFHYKIDARQELLAIIPKDMLYKLSDTLQHDMEAVQVLSTYAINYMYLVEQILFPRRTSEMTMFLESILKTTASYDDDAENSLLFIYLLTHCIIGASNFYESRVDKSLYKTMVTLLETRIANHFDNINLDNKFEFLVCCRIVGHDTPLRTAIEHEAQQSISTNGTFLVDTVNQAGQRSKTSFADSEHRNVLYIMSQLDFQPVSQK